MRTFTVLVSALSLVGVNSLCLLPNDATTLANNFGLPPSSTFFQA